MNTAALTAGTVPIQSTHWIQQLKQEGRLVLKLSITLPRLIGESPGVRRVNRYYQRLGDQWRERWTGPLYARACAAQSAAIAASLSFRPWEVQVDYTITSQTPTLLSLYWDAYENIGGAHGLTVRHGDTWQLPSGTPISLRDQLPGPRNWRSWILQEISRQVTARVASGEGLYFEAWPALIRTYFSPERFYLTPDGPVVFYPLYSIAPYAEGIPTFVLSNLSQEN